MNGDTIIKYENVIERCARALKHERGGKLKYTIQSIYHYLSSIFSWMELSVKLFDLEMRFRCS